MTKKLEVSKENITKSVIAIAGEIDRESKTLMFSPNLPGWVGKPIYHDFSSAVGSANLVLGNDAAAEALGESVFGVGKPYTIVAYLSLGTGVGGAKVVGKKIDAHAVGFEPGHQTINFDDTPPGTFESYASAKGFERQFGMKPETCQNQDVWSSYGKLLAVGITNAIFFWSPEAVVLGGSIAQSADKFVSPLIDEVKKRMAGFTRIPDIKRGTLGEEAGLYGGCVL